VSSDTSLDGNPGYQARRKRGLNRYHPVSAYMAMVVTYVNETRTPG
jgi:hypothetical protein